MSYLDPTQAGTAIQIHSVRVVLVLVVSISTSIGS